MTNAVLFAERYSAWVVGKDANIMEDMQRLIDENRELKMAVSRFTDECERLTGELKDALNEISDKGHYIAKLEGMVEAFEICVKARK